MRPPRATKFIRLPQGATCPRLYNWLRPEPIVGSPAPHARGHVVATGRADVRPLVIWCAGAIIFFAAAAIVIDTQVRYKPYQPDQILPGAHKRQRPPEFDFGLLMVSGFPLAAGLSFAWLALVAASTRIRVHADLETNQLHITKSRLGKTRSSTAQLQRCTLTLTPHSEYVVGQPGTRIHIFALMLTPPDDQPVALFASSQNSDECARQSVAVAESWMRSLQLDCAVTPDEALCAASGLGC